MTLTVHLAGARTFASLRNHRNYRLYFVGQVVSLSGTWMQNTAQAWLVLQLSGSASAVGLLAVFQFGPFALFGLAGGVFADRFDRRRTLVVTQSLPIAIAAALAVLAFSGRATVWEVYLLAALNGLVLVLDTPARQAFTVEMVGHAELPNAIALNSSLFNASRIIGPGLAGLLIAWVGVGACFAVNALSYVAVVAGLLAMRAAELHTVRQASPRLLRGIGEGLRYAAGNVQVRVVLLIMLLVATVGLNFTVLLPVLTSRTLESGATVLGLLSASFGAGALAGALLSASLGRASFAVLLSGAAGLGAAELLLAPLHNIVAVALLLVACGACFSLYTSNSNSTLQLVVPDELRGRVLALYAYVFFGTAPLGGYAAGWLSEQGGTLLAFCVAGGTVLASAAAGAAWWRRQRTRAQPRRTLVDPSGAVAAPLARLSPAAARLASHQQAAEPSRSAGEAAADGAVVTANTATGLAVDRATVVVSKTKS